MADRVIKVPDVGEGIAEAEVVELRVKVGDVIQEEDIVASIMTDKATVEIPTPVAGKVTWLGGEVGQVVAIGAALIKVAPADATDVAAQTQEASSPAHGKAEPEVREVAARGEEALCPTVPGPISAASAGSHPDPHADPDREARENPARGAVTPLASPHVRAYARNRGVQLQGVSGSGKFGRIVIEDIDRQLRAGPAQLRGAAEVERIKITGLRRKIATRLQSTKQRIPHFSYVEEVDVSELEALRRSVNEQGEAGQPRLTLLPFIVQALTIALKEFPRINGRFEDAEEILEVHGGIHVGIATQTQAGLMVPVLRHAEARSIYDCAREIVRLAGLARSGKITTADLTGSTITVTSLGAVGGIVTTPVINSPEVAIIGVNKVATRAVWMHNSFQPRQIMNLSSSFDHRIVDGFDAAAFIQRLRGLLEKPALIFMRAP